MNISPGSNVDIVLDFDWSEETIDVRSATVYDLDDQRIILSQTSPPIGTHSIGKRVNVTYLVREKDGPARYCITGRLAEIVRDYRLSGSGTAEALVIIQEPSRERFNLRLFYRLEPPTDSGIVLFLNEEKVNIIDISIGGAKFTHRKDQPVKPKKILKLILQVDEESFDVKAQVVRIFPVSGRMAKKLESVAVQFLNLDRGMIDLLSKKIRDIEREMRYRDIYAEGG
ncbi:MAG: PilZ domain-containing protein [Deltaproteobacteria bacterium]|nr:PilZ domain-containing protein [Deltaproteobacteria bacterium]MBW1795399.1 PilZ domain-containing protein [Deltaproteobacteria bacterium]MBW2331100.1 PilZ domain-containing protein [Deltaproteobacteria bacterium]